MKTFVEARRAECALMDHPRRVEECRPMSYNAWTGEELWICTQTHEQHQAWYDESYGLVGYYNTQTGEMVVGTHHVESSDNRVMVLDKFYFNTPYAIYLAA